MDGVGAAVAAAVALARGGYGTRVIASRRPGLVELARAAAAAQGVGVHVIIEAHTIGVHFEPPPAPVRRNPNHRLMRP
jgi:hypothetical protein